MVGCCFLSVALGRLFVCAGRLCFRFANFYVAVVVVAFLLTDFVAVSRAVYR